MRQKVLRLVFCFILINSTLLSFTPASLARMPDELAVTECKLKQLEIRRTIGSNSFSVSGGAVRIGFPLSTFRVSGVGNQNVLVLPIDFSDVPSELGSVDAFEYFIEPKKVNKFYSIMSDSALNLTFSVYPKVHRMKLKSEDYGSWTQGRKSWGLFADVFNSEITNVLNEYQSERQYSSLAILVLGKSDAWKAWGNGGSAITSNDAANYFYGQNNLRNSIFLVDEEGVGIGDLFIHEFGHLLGFVDLYATPDSVGNSTGPFDVMAYHWANSKTFLTWNLWLKGWIPDDRVVCLQYRTQVTSQVYLDKIGTNTGKRMIVIKEDDSSAIVIEPRLNTEFDLLGENTGILVYRVTPMPVAQKGYIQIIPHANEVTNSPIAMSDTKRFSKAPIPTGEYVQMNSLLIENFTQNSNGINVGLHWGDDASKRKNELDDSKSKAAAELKAKQEAEAAAWLKAKQEAEAKAAAELKAKQEAEAKAAAELKAKQEAEAKAAVELKAKQEAEAAAKAAAAKKITITCVKGKIIKKVTATKPKCPMGFKKK